VRDLLPPHAHLLPLRMCWFLPSWTGHTLDRTNRARTLRGSTRNWTYVGAHHYKRGNKDHKHTHCHGSCHLPPPHPHLQPFWTCWVMVASCPTIPICPFTTIHHGIYILLSRALPQLPIERTWAAQTVIGLPCSCAPPIALVTFMHYLPRTPLPHMARTPRRHAEHHLRFPHRAPLLPPAACSCHVPPNASHSRHGAILMCHSRHLRCWVQTTDATWI